MRESLKPRSNPNNRLYNCVGKPGQRADFILKNREDLRFDTQLKTKTNIVTIRPLAPLVFNYNLLLYLLYTYMIYNFSTYYITSLSIY